VTLTAIFLIALSAFAHAFWNFLSKRKDPSITFFWIASVVSAFALLPALAAYGQGRHAMTLDNWLCVAATGFFQAVYYLGLAGAYQNGDISVAYPLARALPVLFIALISIFLGRGDQIGVAALAGFGMVAFGCILLPLLRFRDFHLDRYLSICCVFAALAAAGTTGYTLVDDQVLRNLRSAATGLSNPEVTLFFMALENISLVLVLGVFVIARHAERSKLASEWRSLLLPAGLAGVVMTCAYGLVLMALAHVQNVSYASAFRQISLPIGATLGMLFGNEPRPRPRLAGLGAILLGLLLVALG
jgi:drug/metabolite transporter (DMT)-like permease